MRAHMREKRGFTWVSIAKRLLYYIRNYKCMLCGETIKIEVGAISIKTLSRVYKHFKERHPEIIVKIADELKQSALSSS